MTFNKGMMTSKKQDWTTPKAFYEELNKEFNFDFDPCPVNPQFDGLAIEWGESNFVNPPYNELAKWIKKAYEENQKGKKVVMLIPARTDTKAFHQYIYHLADLRFIKGRLKFGDGKAPAPFPSMIVIFKAKNKNYNSQKCFPCNQGMCGRCVAKICECLCNKSVDIFGLNELKIFIDDKMI